MMEASVAKPEVWKRPMTKQEEAEAERWLKRAVEANMDGESVRVANFLVEPGVFFKAPPLRKSLGPIPLPRLAWFKWYRRWEMRVHVLRLVEDLEIKYALQERKGKLH